MTAESATQPRPEEPPPLEAQNRPLRNWRKATHYVLGGTGSGLLVLGNFMTAVNWRTLDSHGFLQSFPLAGALLLGAGVIALGLLLASRGKFILYPGLATLVVLGVTHYSNEGYRKMHEDAAESGTYYSDPELSKASKELAELLRESNAALAKKERYGGWTWLTLGSVLVLVAGVLGSPYLFRLLARNFALFEPTGGSRG